MNSNNKGNGNSPIRAVCWAHWAPICLWLAESEFAGEHLKRLIFAWFYYLLTSNFGNWWVKMVSEESIRDGKKCEKQRQVLPHEGRFSHLQLHIVLCAAQHREKTQSRRVIRSSNTLRYIVNFATIIMVCWWLRSSCTLQKSDYKITLKRGTRLTHFRDRKVFWEIQYIYPPEVRQVDSIRCEQNSHITRTIKSNEHELPSWARLFSNSNPKPIKVLSDLNWTEPQPKILRNLLIIARYYK